jgi:hypothetical protein
MNNKEAELAKLTIGSMVKVADLEESKWYWVIIGKRLKDQQWFQGLIDPGCITGTPTLRYGGDGVLSPKQHNLYLAAWSISRQGLV